MKSRTSFYNKGFGKNLLRRFWPLWALWLLALLYAPLQLAGIKSIDYFRETDFVNTVNRAILETGTELAKICIFAMPVMAMAMVSYLYDRRSCGLVNSLPMRREEAYFTAFFTGLAPMLAAEVLAFLVMLAVCPRVPGVNMGHLGLWLLLVVLATAAFYGLACFCGTLTGNVFVLPAVYVVLGCTAQVFEGAVHALLHTLVYGFTYQQEVFSWLSPLPTVLMTLNVTASRTLPADPRGAESVPMTFSISGLRYLALLCAVGLLLGLLAVLILKQRHMESAGEIVAVPVLRPIFRICMAVGTAVVLACLLCEEFLSRIVYGRGLAVCACVLLALGAALGWFIAEMLIKKTLRVFRRGWKQIGIVAGCLVLLAILAEADVAGYERYVPDEDEVASVTLQTGSRKLTDPASIAAYCDFHRGVVAHKAANEQASSTRYWNMPLTYTLKNGKTVERSYRLISSEQAQADPDSDLNRYQALANMPEAILHRVTAGGRSVEEGTVAGAYVNVSRYDGTHGWTGDTLLLTTEQALRLYREGILPDARAGKIGLWFVYESDESRTLQSTVGVTLELTPKAQTGDEGSYYWDSVIDLNVLMCSENTLRWLKENLGVEPENQAALQQPGEPKLVA